MIVEHRTLFRQRLLVTASPENIKLSESYIEDLRPRSLVADVGRGAGGEREKKKKGKERKREEKEKERERKGKESKKEKKKGMKSAFV